MKKYITSLLLFFCALILFAVAISNITELNKLENTQYEEYLKMLVLIIMGLFSIYGAMKEIKPKFELLNVIFKLNPKQKYKIDQFLGLSVILSLTAFFIYSTISGLIHGEIRFYSPVYEVDWVTYKNNPSLFVGALIEHIPVTLGLIYFWVWKIKSYIKLNTNEKSNN